jgi:exodeoxyribonuclease VII large subunit
LQPFWPDEPAHVDPDKPIGVAALTRRIQLTLGDFGPQLVTGELSQGRVAPSGHWYGKLKEGQDAIIDVVMWRSAVARSGAIPKDGDVVVVRGTIDVYPPRGSYQLVASRISPAGGQGDLAARLEALKCRLEAEGLFAEDAKIPLPMLPRAVGLATAGGSAALADLLHSVTERFPAMPVVHAPCLVQGKGAAAAIVAAIRALDAHPEVDVIICGRGGGSLEDLWAFNEEAVVRAIAACRTPIVSAVGHETDWTLADLAADVRAKTPTAAGELVVPVAAELQAALVGARARLDAGVARILAEARARLAGLVKHRALAGPGYQIAIRRQRLDELRATLEAASVAALTAGRSRLSALGAALRPPHAALAAAHLRLDQATAHLDRAAIARRDRLVERLVAASACLDALSPLAVIGRGYGVLRTEGHRLVRHLADVPPGTRFEARVSDGWIQAESLSLRAQRLAEPEEPYG